MTPGLKTPLTLQFCFLLLLFSRSAPAQSGADSSSRWTQRESNIKAFLEEEIEFDRYLFPPGKFPPVRWKHPAAVAEVVNDVPLAVEFYDPTFTRVAKAKKTGRYGAVVRGTTKDGFPIVRYATLYCSEAFLDDYGSDVPLSVNPLPAFGIPKSRWLLYQQNARRFSFGSLLTSPTHDPDAAVFLAGLSEVDPRNGGRETPRLRDRQWWLDFKRQHDGAVHPPVTLPLPRSDAPSAVVAEAREKQHGPFGPAQTKELRAICAAWSDTLREPLVALVVYKGRVVFHEAFGKQADGNPMRRSTPTWMASITKLLTGILVMQFVDRGLLDLDAPLDRYLSEFTSPCPLTLRSLLTHTSGLSWAGEWASDWNASVENQVALAASILPSERTFKYHRVGYALAGKVIERLTGLTAPALMDRMIIEPLDMKSAFTDNTYGGLYCTASDLARVGQMLLNHGRYGRQMFFSEQSWNDMLPRPLKSGDVDLNRSWGIGTSLLGGKVLSPRTFGHEAASGALFRIDPVNELVVILGCNSVGPDYEFYKRSVSRFLQGVIAPLKSSKPNG